MGCAQGRVVGVKLRLVRALQRYVLNPPVKLLFGLGVVPLGYALLETVGRARRKCSLTTTRVSGSASWPAPA